MQFGHGASLQYSRPQGFEDEDDDEDEEEEKGPQELTWRAKVN